MPSMHLDVTHVLQLSGDEFRLLLLALAHTANCEHYQLSRTDDQKAMQVLNDALLRQRKTNLDEKIRRNDEAISRSEKLSTETAERIRERKELLVDSPEESKPKLD